jgi:hypothetical protein
MQGPKHGHSFSIKLAKPSKEVITSPTKYHNFDY